MEPPERDTPVERGSRRKVLLSIVMVMLVSTSGCGPGRSRPAGTSEPAVTIAATRGNGASLIWLAEAGGHFAKENLAVEIVGFDSDAAAVEAVRRGVADIATATEWAFVTRWPATQDFRIITRLAQLETNSIIARRDSGINAPEDLSGARVGLTRGTASEFLLGQVLERAGLSPKSVEVVNIAPPDLEGALLKGEVDAVASWEPLPYNLQAVLGDNGVRFELGGGVNSGTMDFLAISTRDWLESNPESTEKLLRALVLVETWILERPERLGDFLQRSLNLDTDYLEYLLPKIDHKVDLPQTLLSVMEAQTRWAVQNELLPKSYRPNYLGAIHTESLTRVDPRRVRIMRQEARLP